MCPDLCTNSPFYCCMLNDLAYEWNNAGIDLVLIQTSPLFFMPTSVHLYEKEREDCIKTRSPATLLLLKDQVTRHTTVKWTILLLSQRYMLKPLFFPVGYSLTVFGVESTCKLTEQNMENKEDFPVLLEVVPSMPVLQVSTSLPKVRSQPPDPDAPQSAPLVTAVTLYAGQR